MALKKAGYELKLNNGFNPGVARLPQTMDYSFFKRTEAVRF